MKDSVRITVIATGFERPGATRRAIEPTLGENAAVEPTIESDEGEQRFRKDTNTYQPRRYDLEDFDIPAFIRNSDRYNGKDF